MRIRQNTRNIRLCIQMKSMECVYAHNCIIYLPWEMFQMKFCITLCQPSPLPPLQTPSAGILWDVSVSENKSEEILLEIPPGKCAHKYISSAAHRLGFTHRAIKKIRREKKMYWHYHKMKFESSFNKAKQWIFFLHGNFNRFLPIADTHT